MATGMIEALAKRYRFDEWATPQPLERNATVWRFDVRNAPLGAWQPGRVLTLPQGAPPRAMRGLGAKGEVTIHDAVLMLPRDQERLLRLAVFECASRLEARAQLLRVLGEFETMLLERSDSAGEVAFSMPGGTAVAFTRGNLVVVLRNGGARVAGLASLGRDFEKLLDWPRRAAGERMPLTAKTAGARVGRAIPLRVEPAERTTIVFHARGGEVELVRGKPVLRPDREGDAELLASALRSGKPVAASRLALRVK